MEINEYSSGRTVPSRLNRLCSLWLTFWTLWSGPTTIGCLRKTWEPAASHWQKLNVFNLFTFIANVCYSIQQRRNFIKSAFNENGPKTYDEFNVLKIFEVQTLSNSNANFITSLFQIFLMMDMEFIVLIQCKCMLQIVFCNAAPSADPKLLWHK